MANESMRYKCLRPECQVEFIPARRQIINGTIYCSRFCANSMRSHKLHAASRVEVKCHCGNVITVRASHGGQQYCSRKCSDSARFGSPSIRRSEINKEILETLHDEVRLKKIKNRCRYLSYLFDIESDDIFQEYFLRLAEGRKTILKGVVFDLIREKINRGITGKRIVPAEAFVNPDLLSIVKSKKEEMSEYEIAEYIYDLKSHLSEMEFKVLLLAMKGFSRAEVYEDLKAQVTRRNFVKIWQNKSGVLNAIL